MNNTITIALKETKAYFSTPTAYIVGAMFLVLTGIFFVFDMTRPFAEAKHPELRNLGKPVHDVPSPPAHYAPARRRAKARHA